MTMLMKCAKLEQRLADPQVRLLDVRPQEEYANMHIPGAVHVDIEKWKGLASSTTGLQNSFAWSQCVAQLGIQRSTNVVIYGAKLPEVARAWWLLKYVGVHSLSILDGGWHVWRSNQRRPVETIAPIIHEVEYSAEFDTDRLELLDHLANAANQDEVAVVDARSEDEFSGTDAGTATGGHIPGAVNLEWKELLSPTGMFKPPTALHELFTERGIRPEQTAIAC